MNAGQASARRLAIKAGSPSADSVCFTCRLSITRRHYAQAAAAAVAEAPTSMSSTSLSSENAAPKRMFEVRTGVVLSRAPMITRDLHPFEKAFYLYQRRLNERLAMPFTKYLWYKKNTPLDRDEKKKRKERLTFAKDIGKYHAYGAEGWHDELLVGAKESEPEHQLDALLHDAELPDLDENQEGAVKHEQVQRPAPRVTEADKRNDQKSLNRLLQRTLYLLVKDQRGRWSLPEAPVDGFERLHRAAERIIVETGGLNMNTWVIGNVPVGHYAETLANPVTTNGIEKLGEKTFYMKARIFAGQANVEDSVLGVQDFCWLAKEEVQPLVSPKYWKAIHDMLADR
ncbi:50S ribosomal subunit L30 [Pseudovirgaria hyperparasitica]|uniref:Large ribosomal subunit protein mL46 n=1 Tax=Pseudovirgaria hyperparasitica TaxID=470096 RepID=A0A6A6WML1_9PEZI|nr:50S ribosomal subunit L30 [Pseudovirgaria hyperparasitica]KAF2763444.1 50S ribosomal subunit L30 [Pseudovirgaria hyperparasitica]